MRFLGALLIGTLALAGCDDHDDPDLPPDDDDGAPVDPARDFTLRIENVAPWTVLKAGSAIRRTDQIDGPLAPTQAYEIRFTAGEGHLLGFAAMLVESNDWFFAPDPAGIPLYSNGAPLSGDITHLVKLWDAGTEFDQEPGIGDATGLRQPNRNFGELDPEATVHEVGELVRLDDGTMFRRPAIPAMVRVTLTPGPDRGFVLRIENVSTATTLPTSQGALPVTISSVAYTIHRTPNPMFDADQPARANGLEHLAEAGQADPLGTTLRFERGVATPLAPGAFVIHQDAAPLFAPGTADFGAGLEALAEDGNPAAFGSVFDRPVGAESTRAALPGEAFEVTFRAAPGDLLSFATMFAMSNDWFFAPGPEGIALFDGDRPRWGDVTPEVLLWDLGTEVDEELDVGPAVGTQQAAPDTGRDDRVPEVREVTADRYEDLPIQHLRVTLSVSAE